MWDILNDYSSINLKILIGPGSSVRHYDRWFLVGAFSIKEKSPTITVTSFFRQTTECMRNGEFLQNY